MHKLCHTMQFSSQYINQRGKRQNNEDSILCNSENGLFIVCDGVGGNNKGEVASNMACSVLAHELSSANEVSSSALIQGALAKVEVAFTQHIAQNPESNGMATTLAMLHLNGFNATITHIGDSRVYHIRDGNILYKTKDHSLVNELITSGYLTEEEATSHPQKNVITRALQASTVPVIADMTIIDNIEKSDYFLLCTDGILEGIDEHFIKEKFRTDANIDDLKQQVEDLCAEKSNDNFSAVFIKICEGKIEPSVESLIKTEPLFL